jgi:hypothetical protein
MFRHQHAGQYKNFTTAITSFENVENLKYLGTTITSQNSSHEEMKSKVNLWNAW